MSDPNREARNKARKVLIDSVSDGGPVVSVNGSGTDEPLQRPDAGPDENPFPDVPLPTDFAAKPLN